jgi:hypothetical protein
MGIIPAIGPKNSMRQVLRAAGLHRLDVSRQPTGRIDSGPSFLYIELHSTKTVSVIR